MSETVKNLYRWLQTDEALRTLTLPYSLARLVTEALNHLSALEAENTAIKQRIKNNGSLPDRMKTWLIEGK